MESVAKKKDGVCLPCMHCCRTQHVNRSRSIDDAVVAEVAWDRELSKKEIFTLQLLALNTYLYKQSNKEEY